MKSFLSTGPRRQIFALMLDGRDYTEALWELKRENGEKPWGNGENGYSSAVINAYVEKIQSWSKLKDASGISNFCTQVVQLVQVFQTMNFVDDLEGVGLLAELTSKLPNLMKEFWGSYIARVGKGNPTVHLFDNWIVAKRGFSNGRNGDLLAALPATPEQMETIFLE